MADGLARAGFDLDLELGEFREGALAEALRFHEPTQIEVKSDFRCRETGNLFIEYAQPDLRGGTKPSGIEVTTARCWAFEYDDDCWLIVPTARLRQAVQDARQDPSRLRRGGDYNRYHGVLVPIDWLVHRELAA